MTTLLDLAVALSDALERETAALQQGDYDTAARLATAKLAALKAFTDAAAGSAVVRPTPPQEDPDPEGQADLEGQAELEGQVEPEAGPADPPDILERLRDAAHANRAALESALAVQGRVVEMVTGVLRAHADAALGYGSAGPALPAPFVISVKA